MVLTHALKTTNKLHQNAIYIEEITKQCNGNSHTMLAAGDWNATLHPSDRSEGNHSPTAQKHAQNCTDLQLQTTAGHTRQHTYHCYQHHIPQHSRIIYAIYIFSRSAGYQTINRCPAHNQAGTNSRTKQACPRPGHRAAGRKTHVQTQQDSQRDNASTHQHH